MRWRAAVPWAQGASLEPLERLFPHTRLPGSLTPKLQGNLAAPMVWSLGFFMSARWS